MKKSLLFIFIWMAKISAAQYCWQFRSGYLQPRRAISAPGITDYNNFPCVHNHVPYSETIQIYFPTEYFYLNYNITADSIATSTLSPTCPVASAGSVIRHYIYIYGRGRELVAKISGTANEQPGAYQLNIYGRVFTPYGVLPGTLDNIGFQFFLNVVGQNDTCTPVNVQSLHTACATPTVDTACHFSLMMATSPTVTGCQFDSTSLIITQPTGTGYQYEFAIFSNGITDTIFPFGFRIDSSSATATVYNTDAGAFVSVKDSNGCTAGTIIDISPRSGPIHAPTICYATADSNSANGNSLTLVFERDNWFNNIATYTIYRQDYGNGTIHTVGVIPANDPGYITDTLPVAAIDSAAGPGSGETTYTLTCQTACSDTLSGGTYSPFILGVDTNPGGYPNVYWVNSNPINYNEISVFSRYSGR